MNDILNEGAASIRFTAFVLTPLLIAQTIVRTQRWHARY